jgi:hypothetical protein
MIKILAYGNKDSGCTWHRITLPLGFLPDTTAFLTNVMTANVLAKDDWQIFYYNRLSPFDNNWQAFKDQTGMKVVMDIDDWWVLPPNHLNYHHGFAERVESNLRNADLVTCTHERLAEKIRPFNENVVVLPNALPFGLNQYRDDRQPDIEGKIRLFWAGGISHVNDIEILRQPMKRIKTLPGIKAVIGGYSNTNQFTKDQWDKMVSAFTCGLQIEPVVLGSTTVDRYMDHFMEADIMLVPLEGTAWHGYKSNLKLLEAASKRIPVVVSKVHPYIEDNPPVFHVERQSGWYVGVKDLLDPELRLQMGNDLHDWAIKNFHLTDINIKRRSCFQNLLQPSKDISTTTMGM